MPLIEEALKGEANWQLVKSFDDTQEDSLRGKVTITMVPLQVDMDETTYDVLGIKDLSTPFLESGGKKQLHACDLEGTSAHCKPNTGDFVGLVIKNTSD